MRKFYFLLSAMAFMVAGAKAQSSLTTLNGVDTGKAYTISTASRGSWYAPRGAATLESTVKAGVTAKPYDPAQQFAIVPNPSNNGQYFLYSIGSRKFVTLTTIGGKKYSALSPQPNATSVLTLQTTTNTNYPVVITLNGTNQLGVSNSYSPSVIAFWNELNDGGNQVKIEPVGDYDITAAQAQISNVTVTYNLMYNGAQVGSATVEQNIGTWAELPASLKTIPFCTYTYSSETVDPANSTITVTANHRAPFTASSDYANATWYYLMNNNGYYAKYDPAITTHLPLVLTPEASNDDFLWAFIGTPLTGYKIVNKGAGDSKNLYIATAANGSYPLLTTDAKNDWTLLEGKAKEQFGFQMGNFYLNDYAGAHKLSFWQDGPKADNGSNWSVALAIPAQGSYVRLKSKSSGNYLTSTTNSSNILTTAATTLKDASTIWYWSAEGLLSYAKGQYLNGNTKGLAPVGTNYPVTIEPNTHHAGYYAIKTNAYYTYNASGSSTIDRGMAYNNHAGYAWSIEPVSELPLELNALGDGPCYSTLYLPVNVALEGAVAYGPSLQGDKLVASGTGATEVPATTGVVLVGNAITARAVIANNAAPLSSALSGIVAAATKGTNQLVLGIVNSQVGFYTPGSTTLKGHKAYYASSNGVKLEFNFGDEATAIERIANEENAPAAIYDLAGRRVSKAVKGIYIINGKKVVK